MWIRKVSRRKTSFCFKYINNIYFLLKRQSLKIPFSSQLVTCYTNTKLRYQSFVPFKQRMTSRAPQQGTCWNNCFVWHGMVMVSNLCRSSSRVQFAHVPLGPNCLLFLPYTPTQRLTLALMAWPDINMQPAHSSDMTQTRAAAPVNMHQVQLLRKCLRYKQPCPISLGGKPQGPNPARRMETGTSC